MRKLAMCLVVVGLASSARAQRSVQITPGELFSRVNIEPDFVKGAPYSAEIVNESVQVLSDGNRIVHRTTSRIYRDSEGRTRREVDRPVVPEVSITDPVAERSYTVNVEARTARENPLLSRLYNANAELERMTVVLNGQLQSFVARGATGGFVLNSSNEQAVEEKLTPKTIEGLRVEGVRRTTTIQAGAIGNERPIVVTSEQWTSPDLKVLVLSESSDPRTGTSTYKLVNVKRGDPPASLFQVPADFTIVAGPGRGGRGRQ